MKSKDEIIEIQIADIDLYLIDRVRDLRTKRKVSQVKLSIALGLAEGAVSKIENPKQRAKYNIRHINLLARALSCTPADLLPNKPLKFDIVKVKLRILKDRQPDGKPNYEVISKTPISD